MNYNNVIPKDFDYDNSHIIKPPVTKPSDEMKYTRTIICSKDRDKSLYPRANNYVVNLETEIDEVVTGEIILMDIPFTSYLINYNNSKVLLNNKPLYIEEGDYDKAGIASALQDCLNANADSLTFTVAYVDTKDNFLITCASGSDFTLQIDSYLCQILGFEQDLEYTSSSFKLKSTYRCNLDVNKYIILYIDYMTINVSSTNNIHKSTAVVYKNEMSINTRSTITQIKKWFNPIIPRLQKIRVRMTDEYGNPYDFQNQDHRIDILYESRKRSIKYTGY
jgi:hypothetical protein